MIRISNGTLVDIKNKTRCGFQFVVSMFRSLNGKAIMSNTEITSLFLGLTISERERERERDVATLPATRAMIRFIILIEPSEEPKEISCRARSYTSVACRVELPYSTGRNGYIDGYEVSYREVDTEEWDRIYVGNNAILSYVGDIREFFISDLLPNTMYYLNVSLYNNVSNSIRVGPFLSVGLVATSNPVPGAPSQLILSTINSNSITASWSLPSRLDSEVTNYELILSQLSGPTHKLKLLVLDLNSSVSSYTFSGLDADTSYSVSVAAGNSNGLGFEMENQTTLNPGPPSPPNFRISIYGSTVFLEFSPGATGGSPILSYRLEYSWNGENWLEINTFNSSARKYSTRSLPPGTFLIRAVVVTLLGEAGSEELIIIIPDRSLLNELSVQIVIGVAVLLLILSVIAATGCICILYIRRKSRINYKFSRNNILPKINTQHYSSDSIQDSWDETCNEQVRTQYLTEEQIVIGTPPDYGNFEIGSTVQSIEGIFTPVYLTTSHLLHLSPSISSLQKPFKNDCSLYPVWSKPPLFESPAHEPVPTTESRSYVDMKALQLEEEKKSTCIESSTISDGDEQTVSELPEEQYSPPKIFQNHYQMSLTPVTPGTILDSPYQEEHRLPYDPMFANTSEWSISTTETDPRCQTFV
ncbi:Receptor-type tyrosine-protein phosphatase F isoform X6 [Oopsacas minuta]|uniref:Receptor-type tyrosine-protein phosphatase F isoform X6 n=1 Tax=Oopsacas minuta TaxID=111878 RepID=A0AAV7JC82_9METZ|nr:Receptor-type tyrosine-protein phosphatase F isoform X6 [Oopsacas minuta]